jgi:heat shock protein HslJ
MAGDIEQLVRDTAQAPTRPVDASRLVRRARRDRVLARAGTAVGSLIVIGAAVVLLPTGGDGRPVVTDRPDGVTDDVPPPEAEQSADELWGRTYGSVEVVAEGDDRQLLDGTRILLGLGRDIPVTKLEGEPAIVSDADGYATWRSGCNWKGQEVSVVGNELEFGGYGSFRTEMLCPPAKLEQDRWVDAFFGASPSWQLREGVLELSTSDLVIVFEVVDSSSGDARDQFSPVGPNDP